MLKTTIVTPIKCTVVDALHNFSHGNGESIQHVDSNGLNRRICAVSDGIWLTIYEVAWGMTVAMAMRLDCRESSTREKQYSN